MAAVTSPAAGMYTRRMPLRCLRTLAVCALLLPSLPASLLAAPAQDPVKALDLIRPQRVQQARGFEVPTPAGGLLKLSDYRGKVVFLNFWATWCPPCKEEMPALERLHRRFGPKGLAVLAISTDPDGASVVVPFVKQNALTFPVALDPRGEVTALYGVRALPATIIIDRQGNLALIALGPRGWDDPPARALFESLLR